MARRRDYAAEYARRQELARARGRKGYYQERIERAQAKRPGVSRAQARGHRSAADLPAAIRRAARRDGWVSFIGFDRQPDGTWRRASFTVGSDEGEREFILGPHVKGPGGLAHLRRIAKVIYDSGVLFFGGKYLQAMIESVG